MWGRESEDHGPEVARKEEQERTCPTSKISSSREGWEGKLEKAGLLESQGEKETNKYLEKIRDDDGGLVPEATLEKFGDGKRVSRASRSLRNKQIFGNEDLWESGWWGVSWSSGDLRYTGLRSRTGWGSGGWDLMGSLGEGDNQYQMRLLVGTDPFGGGCDEMGRIRGRRAEIAPDAWGTLRTP